MNQGTSKIEMLQRGLAFHQAGQLAEAEQMYQTVLRLDAKEPNALNLMGVIEQTRGQSDKACTYFDRAIAAAPHIAAQHFNRAAALESMGRNDEALKGYHQAIQRQNDYTPAWLNAGALQHRIGRLKDAIKTFQDMSVRFPRNEEAFYNLGVSLHFDKQYTQAEAMLRKAVSLNASHHAAFFALSNLLAETGRLEDAVIALRSALQLAPNVADYHSSLGNLLAQVGDQPGALEAHNAANTLTPNHPRYLTNLGAALLLQDRQPEACAYFQRALAIDPNYVDASFNLALALDDAGRAEEAIALLKDVIARDPQHIGAHQAISTVYAALGRTDEARSSLLRARSLHPSDPMVRFSAALTALAEGDLANGWQDYEARFDLWNHVKYRHKGVRPRGVPPSYWMGEELRDKKILVWTEQGVGDEILFSSLVPDLIKAGANVSLECSARLVPVFRRSFPDVAVTAREESDQRGLSNVVADVQAAVGSLGRYLRPTLQSFPQRESYIAADQNEVSALKARYGSQRLVGISWRSGAARLGQKKSMRLVDWMPVLKTPGVRFVCLQYGDCAAEIAEAQAEGIDIVWDQSINPLTDMEAFTAQVAAMDLVISTSNTTVHVAGALGVLTWVLLPQGAASHWYWFEQRSDSPWYPSVLLFRDETAVAQSGPWWQPGLMLLTDAFQDWASHTVTQ